MKRLSGLVPNGVFKKLKHNLYGKWNYKFVVFKDSESRDKIAFRYIAASKANKKKPLSLVLVASRDLDVDFARFPGGGMQQHQRKNCGIRQNNLLTQVHLEL